MAAMSTGEAEKEIIRKACSDPLFITKIYSLIGLSERLQIRKRLSQSPDTPNLSRVPVLELKEQIKALVLSDHSTTVIGGAAFILHAYEQNGQDINRMHAVPQTSDIDIAMWYNNIIDIQDFIDRNTIMERAIRETFQSFSNQIRTIIEGFDPSAIRTFEIEVPESSTYENMTTNIKVNFIINGQRFTVVDVAMKNKIYSQRIRNGRNRRVEENVTYTTNNNTTCLRIHALPDECVRVPTLERLIEQQQFAIEAMRGRANTTKYQARIDYLRRPPELGSAALGSAALGSAAALNAVRARFTRAVEDTNAMRASLPTLSRSASLPLHPGRSIHSLSKKGGKRRTYRKNKRHTKRRHTKRH